MALRSRLTSQKDGGKHTVTLEVAVTSGSKEDVDIEISWGPNDLGYPMEISPATGVASTTKVIWPEQLVTTQDSVFQVTLQCATSGQHTVNAVGKVIGGDTYTDETTVEC